MTFVMVVGVIIAFVGWCAVLSGASHTYREMSDGEYRAKRERTLTGGLMLASGIILIITVLLV